MIADNEKKNDYETALSYNEKILALDPTNAQAIENQKALIPNKMKVKDNKQKIKTDTTKEKLTPAKTKVKGK